MITYTQLEDFVTKCEEGLEQVKEAYKITLDELALAEENKRMQEEQAIAIEAQILTLKQLMDTATNSPISELPFAEDKIEELFDERLEGRDGEGEEETKDFRKKVYLAESLDLIEEMDALNEEAKETPAGEGPEVSS